MKTIVLKNKSFFKFKEISVIDDELSIDLLDTIIDDVKNTLSDDNLSDFGIYSEDILCISYKKHKLHTITLDVETGIITVRLSKVDEYVESLEEENKKLSLENEKLCDDLINNKYEDLVSQS